MKNMQKFIRSIVLILVVALGGYWTYLFLNRDNPFGIEIQVYASALKGNAVADTFSNDLDAARSYDELTNEDAQGIGLDTNIPDGYRAKYTKVSLEMGLDDISTWGASNNMIFPGNILKIADPYNDEGLSQVIGLKRAAGTISIGLEGSTGTGAKSTKMKNISLASSREAISKLVKENMTTGAQLPLMLSYSMSEVKSQADLTLALGMGLKGNYGTFSTQISSNLELEKKEYRTYAIIMLRQIYYTIDFDYPIESGTAGFFSNSTTLSEIKTFIKEGDVPAYVSTVSYGRLAAIVIKSNDAMDKIRSKLDADFGLGPFAFDTKLEWSIASDIKNMELSFFVYGGSIENNQSILSMTKPSDMIKALNSDFDPLKNVGVPISYTLSHLSDGAIAKLGNVSEYYIKELYPAEYTLKFDANGGSGTMPDQTFSYETSGNIVQSTLSLGDWSFVGWNTALDGSGDEFVDGHSLSAFLQYSEPVIKLYAIWTNSTTVYKRVLRQGASTKINETGGFKTYDDVYISGLSQDYLQSNGYTHYKIEFGFDIQKIHKDGDQMVRINYNPNKSKHYVDTRFYYHSTSWGRLEVDPAIIRPISDFADSGWIRISYTCVKTNSSIALWQNNSWKIGNSTLTVTAIKV